MKPHERHSRQSVTTFTALVLAVALAACGDSTSSPKDSAAPMDSARDLPKDGVQATVVSDAPPVVDSFAALDTLLISYRDAIMSPAVDGPSAEAGPSGQGALDSGVAEVLIVGANDAGETGSGGRDGGTAPEAGVDLAADPLCSSADSSGFFASCSSCLRPGDCDTISVGGSIRRACGCSTSSDCPCGFGCGCREVAPQVRMCGICVRP